jgi:hypothetical protein
MEMAMPQIAETGVEVPTMEEFDELIQQVNDLADRVTALEGGSVPPPDPTKPSPDGTTVTDTTGQIVDVQHRVFKLVGDPSNYTITRDGAPSPSDRVAQLYAKSGVCYQQNQDHDWWAMPGDGWISATDPSVTTPPPNTGGTGPDAQSQFLRIDFTAPQNYKGKNAQQVIDRKLWGVSTGGCANNSYGVWGNAGFQAALATISPGLHRINGNIPERGDSHYFNSDMSVRTQAFDALIQNWSKCDPMGIGSLIVGCNYSTSGNNLDRYKTGMTNLARFLSSAKLPNGKPLPIIGFEAQNEPDDTNTFSDQLLLSIYNTMVDAVKSVNSKLLVSGPVTAWAGSREPYFHNNAKAIDVYNYHVYVGGYPQVPNPPYNMDRGSADIQTIANNLKSDTSAILLGEYNIDWNCQAPDQRNINGAIYDATMLMQCLDGTPVSFWAAIWDTFGDGTCGVITDPGMQVVPGGHFIGAGVRSIYGPRWKVTTNRNGLLVCPVTHDGHIGVMIVNPGKGNQSGPVALAHWPVNSNGNGQVNVWQMKNGGANDGNKSTAQVNAGIVNLDLPDPSITIVSV